MPPAVAIRGGPWASSASSSARGKRGTASKANQGGKGKTVLRNAGTGAKRHRKPMRDCIRGITRPAIRYVFFFFLDCERFSSIEISWSIWMRVKLLKFTEMSEGDEGNLRLAFSSFTESHSVFITSIITCFTHLTYSGVSTTTTHTTSFLPFRSESEANRIFSCSRLARRGGVKRISAMVYDDVRSAMKTWLESVLTDCVTYVEHRKMKTVQVTDVLHALARKGKPIYGFDPDTFVDPKSRKAKAAGIHD
ncbi:uncharacterized protein BDZ83DRAFT_31410 [Colletotrichum acutatum]|uniref:Histone H4 n=1 Tax=Glomerella acutata TaxID=27357 RepID=A0AAD8XLB8_GLOAC|nr:uncharacterized protein BDZ83DRAFT_31410 [Colletotrichum acutatum]KAK1729404.1 hypothetical protein BDZ83DRAFT_31410 [Colletotrichum acutatum]